MGTSLVHKHEIRLAEEQRQRLMALTRNGTASAKKIKHAQVLLLSDRGHREGQRTDTYIAAVLGLHLNTIKRIRKRFVAQGEVPALARQPRATPPRKIDGRVEAHLVALCCSAPPQGRERWTLTLLADELDRRGLVTACRETVRQALKKIRSSPGAKSAGASRKRMRPAL